MCDPTVHAYAYSFVSSALWRHFVSQKYFGLQFEKKVSNDFIIPFFSQQCFYQNMPARSLGSVHSYGYREMTVTFQIVSLKWNSVKMI